MIELDLCDYFSVLECRAWVLEYPGTVFEVFLVQVEGTGISNGRTKSLSVKMMEKGE